MTLIAQLYGTYYQWPLNLSSSVEIIDSKGSIFLEPF